jgi:hypothetical protein
MRGRWLLLGAVCGCHGTCGGSSIARLTAADGAVDRDRAPAIGAFAPASVGDRFELGDGLRTGAGAKADVSFAVGGALAIDERSLVRFLARPDDAPGVAVQFGESTGAALELGVALVDPDSALELARRDGALEVRVVYGRAIIDDDQGRRPLTSTSGSARIGSRAPVDVESSPKPLRPEPATRASGDLLVRTGGEWRPLSIGTSTAGLGLRVPPRGTAVVSRKGAAITIHGPASFELGGEAGPMARLVEGGADVAASGAEAELLVPGGAVVARPSEGRARVSIGTRTVRIQSEGGDVIAKGKGTEALRYGESVLLARSGDLRFDVDLPERGHFAVSAGESATIHDALAPTAVEISFASPCPSGGIVELALNGRPISDAQVRARGATGAILSVPAGQHRYRARCEGRDIGDGRLTVVRDSARKPLPTRSPINVIDADGRKYTILYQNLLPSLTVRWKRAPDARGYVLRIGANGVYAAHRSHRAERDFPPGSLPEGTYELWFEVEGDSARASERTHVSIDFDNAASRVFIRAPDLAFDRSGGRVRIEGAVVSGSRVSVGAEPISLDRHHRFSGDVAVPEGQDGIAVRVEDRRGRVDYYVRRARK